MIKKTPASSDRNSVKNKSKLKPYIVDSREHQSAQQHIKPLHLNVGSLVNKSPQTEVTEINIESLALTPLNGMHSIESTRKNPTFNNEQRKHLRERSATRYQYSKANAYVSSKNIFGIKKDTDAQLVNYSVNGASVLTERELKRGAILQLIMTFSSTDSFCIPAKVVFCKSSEKNNTSTKKLFTKGVELLDPPNEYKDFIIKESIRIKLK